MYSRSGSQNAREYESEYKSEYKKEGGILKNELKVITIRLLSDPPIFQIKPGSRSEVARS